MENNLAEEISSKRIHSAFMVVRNKKGPNFSRHQFFQLCNVEAPTLIINGLLIGWKQTKHSAGLVIRFFGSAKLSNIFDWVWVFDSREELDLPNLYMTQILLK